MMRLIDWLFGMRNKSNSKRLSRLRGVEHRCPVPVILAVLESRQMLSMITAINDSYWINHDQSAGGNVLENDFCYDDFGVPISMTAVMDSMPSNGQIALNSNGDFTYTPNAGWAGTEYFTYIVHGGGMMTNGSVQIEVANTAPNASDDDINISPDVDNQPIPLYVLENDSDPEGDDVTIIAVGSSQIGATITIDVSGKFVWYTPPLDLTELGPMGGTLYFNDELPEDAGDVEEIAEEGGFESTSDFLDTFQYTVVDTAGATAVAFAQVVNQQTPAWEMKLTATSDTAGEAGVDGNPGYDVHINQFFGLNARGIRARDGSQTWQTNRISYQNVFVDAQGAIQLGQTPPGYMTVDVRKVLDGEKTPFSIPDNLGADDKPGQTSLFILQEVHKQIGFNAPRKKLPEGQNYRPNANQIATLQNMSGPTRQLDTVYLFVNKAEILARRANNTLSQADLNAIINSLSNYGVDWNTLPDKIERLQIGALSNWQFTSP